MEDSTCKSMSETCLKQQKTIMKYGHNNRHHITSPKAKATVSALVLSVGNQEKNKSMQRSAEISLNTHGYQINL